MGGEILFHVRPDHSGGSFWFFPYDFTIFSASKTRHREFVAELRVVGNFAWWQWSLAAGAAVDEVYLETAEGCWVSK